MRVQYGLKRNDVRDFIADGGSKSRPDLQPLVLDALRGASWLISSILCTYSNGEPRSEEDILHFDGGQGEKSGQVAGDIIPAQEGRPAIRLTTELDLMLSTPSPEEVEVVDWKSGWKWWTATEVKQCFQFQFGAWCLFVTYPQVKSIIYRVAMVREGICTAPVTFSREKDMYNIHQRMMSAVKVREKYRAQGDAANVEAWASPDKCSYCSALHRCPKAHGVAADIGSGWGDYLKRYVVVGQRYDQMTKLLKEAVKEQGEDIVADGLAFGADKPKAARAPTMDVYTVAK